MQKNTPNNKEAMKERIYEFNRTEKRAIIDCHDNKDKMSINVDPTSGNISIVTRNEEGNITRTIGGKNIPTIIKILQMLDVTVTCKPIRTNNYKS